MNRHLLRLIYLVPDSGKVTITTANFKSFFNKIACDESQFLKADAAELYVTREILEYPINMQDYVQEQEEDDPLIFQNRKMERLYRNVEEFTIDFNFLPISEARQHLREMSNEEVTEFKESLCQIREMIKDTLVEEKLDEYIVLEVEKFLEELREKESSIAYKLL